MVQDSAIDAGMVIKLFMSVNRKRLNLEKMATLVGDNSLAQRMKEMDGLINRGIVKMQSLYLEVEQEPPKIMESPDFAEVNYEEK